MSVFLKSFPLKRRGPPVSLARAKAKQSPKFGPAAWRPLSKSFGKAVFVVQELSMIEIRTLDVGGCALGNSPDVGGER
jgi:hypothetical protein